MKYLYAEGALLVEEKKGTSRVPRQIGGIPVHSAPMNSIFYRSPRAVYCRSCWAQLLKTNQVSLTR